MKSLLSQYVQSAKVIVLALILAVGLNYASAQWSNPPANPPAGNVPAPLNVGPNGQFKSGWLTLGAAVNPNHALDVYGDIYTTNIVGVSHVATGNGGGYVINDRTTWTSDSQWYSPSQNSTRLWSHRGAGDMLRINTANGRFGFMKDPAADATISVNGRTETQQLRVTGGNPAVGRVLTSDASGNATWQLPTSAVGTYSTHESTTPGVDGHVTAVCPANTTMASGGCWCIDNSNGNDSSGHGSRPWANGWMCMNTTGGGCSGGLTAYVRCVQ